MISYNLTLTTSVTRLGDLLHFEQLFKACGHNYFAQISHIFGNFCKVVKICNFSSEIILDNFFRQLATFYRSHCEQITAFRITSHILQLLSRSVWPDGILLFQYLAINSKENLPNCIINLTNWAKTVPNTKYTLRQKSQNFAEVMKFHQIWSHASSHWI